MAPETTQSGSPIGPTSPGEDEQKKAEHNAFFRREMKRAAPWSMLASALRQGGSLLSMVLIARLLTPSDFGIAAVVVSMVGLVVPLVQIGLLQGLVAFTNAPQRLIDSLFWLSIVLSVAAYAILALCSRSFSEFYRIPELAALLPVGLLVIIGQNLFGLVTAKLQRNLDYRIQSYMAGCIPLFSIALGIPLALLNLGSWAIIAPQVVGNFAGAALGIWLGHLSIRPVFQLEGAMPVLRFSARMMLSNVLIYFCNSGTALVTGRYWTSHAVGLYNFGATNNARLYDVVTSPVAPYLLQILAKIEGNKPAIRQSLLEYMKFTQSYLLPIFALLAVCAPALLRVVFGEQWGEAAPYFTALLAVSAARIMAGGTSTIVTTMRHGAIMMASALSRGIMVLAILAVMITAGASPLHTVIALAVSDSLVYLCFIPIGLGLVEAGFSDYLRTVWRPLLVTLALSTALYGCINLIALVWPMNDWIVCSLLAIFMLLHFVILARLYRTSVTEVLTKAFARLGFPAS